MPSFSPPLLAPYLSQNSLPFGSDVPPDLFGPVVVGRPQDGHPVAASLVFSFHEPITLRAGRLTIMSKGVEVAYELLDNPAISIVGNTLVFRPPQALAPSTIYTVFISEGAVRDASGNVANAGVAISAAFMSGPDTAPVNSTGTDGPDTLHGGEQADVLSGMAGADKLIGYGGNDQLDGGAGNDELHGGAGDDVLTGGGGNDLLTDGEGHNILRGGDGDDTVTSPGSGTGLLDGGAGNDALVGNDNTNYSGGEGDDNFHIYIRSAQTRAVIDGGAGADRFEFLLQRGAGGQFAVTGGGGVDTYAFWAREDTLASNAQAVVSDFTPGMGGDRLELATLLPAYFTGDPFGAGLLRLVADGNDTLVQVSRSDADTGAGYLNLLRLANVRSEQLTTANFVGGFDPATAGRGAQLVGTPASDTLRGSPFDDTLTGLDGTDVPYGGGGNDRLDGGDGNDFLHGDAGDDVLLGGNGDDTLAEDGSSTGSNQLAGGAGNDVLTVHSRGTNLLDGGEGDDRLEGGSGNDTLLGGDGDDVLLVRSALGTAPTTISLSGGAGNDRLQFAHLPGNAALSARGGTGADTFVLDAPMATLAVEDFSVAEGDVLDLRPLLPASFGGNPFRTLAYLSLAQSGNDTLVYADLDGANGGGAPVLAARLAGVALASLTSANFAGGHALDGSNPGLRIDGTAAPDTLIGENRDDTLRGFGGADRIHGGAGNDTLDGGADDDTLDGGDDDDILLGGDGDDALTDLSGFNILDGGAGEDIIRSRGAIRSEILGGAGNDYIEADDLVANVDAGPGDDRIIVDFINLQWDGALRIAGGDGNDRITLSGGSLQARTVLINGGAGRDNYNFGNLTLPLLTIQDFQAGANGDLVDIFAMLPADAALGGSNPFGAGWLRLVQRGADTVLQRDSDGAAGPAAWADTVVFSNISAGSLTGENFSEGADPQGSQSGIVRSGTALADEMQGARFDDVLRGGAGDDRISGLEGNDALYGEDGADKLSGGNGNDRLEGGAGSDLLEDHQGANTLHGGDGNDRLVSHSREGGLLSGDAGDDYIEGRAGQVLDGGLGRDRIEAHDLAGAVTRTATIHGGEGNDTVIVRPAVAAGFTVVADGGAGQDTYAFEGQPAGALLKILDFATGDGGDLLDLRSFVPTEVNPFTATNGLQLVQRGPDAVLQTRGPAPHTAVDLIVFANTAAAAIVTANVLGGFAPDGSTVGYNITGTAAGERLIGGPLDDILRGEGGDDTLEGGAGNDQLFGGDGDDQLSDSRGKDTIRGGDGNDQLYGNRGGSDPHAYLLASGLLDGGAGNDILDAYNGYDFAGGIGNDVIRVGIASTSPLQSAIDGGDGDDRIEFSFLFAGQGQLTASGGSGVDTYHAISFDRAQASLAQIRITDFTPGAGGDQLALGWMLPPEQNGNPFITGLFRLTESAAGTLVQVRQSGTDAYLTVLELAGIRPAQLSADNFLGNYDPTGKSSAALPQIGSAAGEWMYGGPLDDTILGLDGQDYLWGAGGNDRLEGGAGKDQLVGEAGNDILIGGDGDDSLFDDDPGAGNNQFHGGAGNDRFTPGDGDDWLSGGEGLDTAYYAGERYFSIVKARDGGFQLSSLLTGTNGTDQLEGIERLVFKDGNIALDIDGVAGQAFRIYRAAFDRVPDAKGAGFWIAQMDKGSSLVEVARGFVASKEFAELYGSAPTNAELVTRMYKNVLHRDPDAGGHAYWLDILDNRKSSLPAVLAAISESVENKEAVAELIANGIPYTPWAG